jgi:hypothetical protein
MDGRWVADTKIEWLTVGHKRTSTSDKSRQFKETLPEVFSVCSGARERDSVRALSVACC